MTLHERISRWPMRHRGYAFAATMTVAFALIVALFRWAAPEITAPLSFWLDVVKGTVVVFLIAFVITPPGRRWRTEP